ncbi:type I-E CRISPR-associated protein Cas5/CasD [Dactylosporangium fulvum]
MQSWGLRGRATIRDTATEPTKSGVVGLLCCALGVSRDNESGIARLAALRMGVRVDREGILERDYHTVQNVPTTSGSGHRTIESQRYYLADALFLVVLEGEPELLDTLNRAVLQPHWPLYLGRKAFVPSRPLVVPPVDGAARPLSGAGLIAEELEGVLAGHPWLENRADVRVRERRRAQRTPLRTVVDCDQAHPLAELSYDYPVNFARDRRTFRARTFLRGQVPLTDGMIPQEADACT